MRVCCRAQRVPELFGTGGLEDIRQPNTVAWTNAVSRAVLKRPETPGLRAGSVSASRKPLAYVPLGSGDRSYGRQADGQLKGENTPSLRDCYINFLDPHNIAAESTILDLFLETGAYLRGHFKLSSGLHSGAYLQSALVLAHPRHAETLGRELAAKIKELAGAESIALVISPALGGLIIGHEVARALGVRFLFTERDSDRRMSLRRGFTLSPGERVVVVEDVITTGGSTLEVIEIVRAAGAMPLAAGSIIDRSGGAADLGIPRAALATLKVESYQPAECPMCQAGEAVTKPGSRPA